MKEFIWKHFVKDYENFHDPVVRTRYTKLTGTLGIFVNSVLCVIKIFLGLATHSVAVIADGVHDMADSMAACITLIGAHISGKPADQGHPYGHARAEYLTSLLVSAIILVVGYQMMKSSIEKCLNPTETDFSWYMVAFMVFAIVFKGSQALFTIATGKHIGSLPIIAAGTDNRNDVISSIVIVTGMLVHHFTGFDPDGYMGCLVSLFILYSGITLVRDTIDPLMGSRPDENTVREMEEIILAHKDILGIHDIILYNYGPGQTFATFHAEVDSRSDLLAIHDVVDHIEREIAERLRITATCHLDPVKIHDPEWDSITEQVSSTLKGFDAVEGFHDLRIALDHGKEVLRIDVVITPGKDYSAQEIVKAVEDAVRQAGSEYKVILDFDQAYTVS